jgi:arylsulfatase A-like enzyme
MIAAFRHAAFYLYVGCALSLSFADSGSWSFAGTVRAAGKEVQPLGPYDPNGPSKDRSPTGGPAGQERPNVLLIGIDTLRADHVGCLGYKRDTTPTLDRLAREGILCTRTLSTSGWTLPSVMSVMTSLYPDVHRTCKSDRRLPQEITTLAEVLKADGYATVGFISNPIIDGRYGFSDGFDLYDDFTVTVDSALDIFERHDTVNSVQYLAATSRLLTRTAVKWLDRNSDKPFFMFVFYIDPHYDYIPPVPYDTMFDPNYEGGMNGRGMKNEPLHSQRPSDRDLRHLLALYDGEIRYTDDCVADLLQAFAKSGVLKNTVVVVFGDHGDEFYEHGSTTHDRTLYDEILHVPLVLWWPDRFPAGRRIEAVTSQVDIMPTILDYLNAPYEGPMQGASLRPLVEGKAERLHDTVWAELNSWIHVQAITDGHHKLIRNMKSGVWELYDLQRDSQERTNLYDQASATDVQLAMMTEWQNRMKGNETLAENLARGSEVEKVPLDEQQILRLKTLGYVQ